MPAVLPTLVYLARQPEFGARTCRQAAILLSVAARPMHVGELAGLLRCPYPAITRACDKLVEHSLVERKANRADARRPTITITPMGQALADRALAQE